MQKIQSSMVKSVRSCFAESEQEDLRCLIRLAVEFNDYLQVGNPRLRESLLQLRRQISDNIKIKITKNELRYSIESIFSGIDSFCSVNSAYRVLVGATRSRVKWGKASMGSLKKQYFSMFKKFITERKFNKKCRLLLDLFKIQIVFAGMFYE